MRVAKMMILVVYMGIPMSILGQEYTRVYDVMRQAYVSPETFDQWVQSNSNTFDEQFRSCANSVLEMHKRQGQSHMDECNKMLDPIRRKNCFDTNENARIVIYVLDILHVINGKITWANTMTGSGIINQRSICQLFGSDYCANFFQRGLNELELVKPFAVCPKANQ